VCKFTRMHPSVLDGLWEGKWQTILDATGLPDLTEG
jgi:hypothetical protein